MVRDPSLLRGQVVVERGRPALERLKANGEGVLPWHQPIALIDHRLDPSKQVPGLVVLHLVELALWSEDVLRPSGLEILPIVAFHIRDIKPLSPQ